jgi:2-polyprenyl-6-methoxyphenol hydroxylase-like FAD-dependent oxidoreductase
MRARSATIVGGGVGGAAAALLLAGAGVETVMVERSATPTLAGAALALAPNGLAVLDGLGLGDAVRARACALRGGAAVRDRDGRVLQRVAPPDLGTRYDHLAIIRRRDLLEILYEALHAAPRVDVRLGVEQAPDAPLDGDLVVGADGIGSVVRVQVDPASEVRPLGVAYMRALVDAAVPDDLVGEWWTPLGLFGVLPVNDASYVYGAASAPPLAAAIAARDIGA